MSSVCGLENEEKRVTSICSAKEPTKEDKIDSARAEMGEVKEENERLKMMLERVEKDYHSLQLRFFDILQGETSKKFGAKDSATTTTTSPDEVEEEEPKLVSLCLGTSPKEPKKERVMCNSSKPNKENEDFEANLTLGLDSSEELKEAAAPEPEAKGTCSTNKSVLRDKDDGDEISEQTPTKRARVCVRVRCDTPTMIDGCQWRKYGQKIAKGNPCPRAYYRCTVAPACPVRKQVQRCAEDMSILITTYEGTHNHPLPVSATAMASTTSAAVSMLLSGSSTSSHQPMGHISATPFGNAPTLFSGLNFSHFDQSRAKQAFLPNTASSQLFPTITLDLTSTSPSSSNRFHLSPSSFASSPRFHPLSLSFSQNYGSVPIEKAHISPLNLGNQFQEHLYQQCIKNQNPFNEALTETLTKAISTDPSLRSAIAAAVSSIERQGSTIRSPGEGEILGSGLSLKLGDNNPQFNSSINPFNKNGKEGSKGHLNKSSSSSSSQGGNNLMLLQTPRPFSLPKSSTSSSNIDHINRWVQEINSHH